MSAFMMTRESLSDLAKTIERVIGLPMPYGHFSHIDRDGLKRVFGKDYRYKDIFDLLHRLNAISVNERYKHTPGHCFLTDTPSSNPKKLDEMQFIKSLECWLYQSCEFSTYKQSEVYIAIKKLCQQMIKDYVHGTKEYNEAKWAY